MMSGQRKIQHLFLRAGFGAKISEIKKHLKSSTLKTAEKLFDYSSQYSEIDLKINQTLPDNDGIPLNPKELSKKEKKKLVKQSRENIKELNISWINKMCSDKGQLRERMTLFWHGHFACKSPVALFMKNQNNTLRKSALGNFGDLLKGISRDPAMLQFLNNQQNRKSSPNENFARELLELFTLGRGNYSEKDIKEAARAFTGWGFERNGEFVIRRRQHDDGEKKFMGKTGNIDGDGIIEILLNNKKTAEHVTRKIYKYFVNEDTDEEIVADLSKQFYESGYDIKKLMGSIFKSDWFYEEKNIGTKIKSPIDFICGLKRSFGVEFRNSAALLTIQKLLGQMILNPPNVAGWSGGKNWIDSSTLMYRMKLPELIFGSADNDIRLPDFNVNNLSRQEKVQMKKLNVTADLKTFTESFVNFSEDELIEEIAGYLLQTDLSSDKIKLIKKYSDYSQKESYVKSIVLRIISLPEYQMC